MSHSEVLGDKTSIYEILGDMVQPITLCLSKQESLCGYFSMICFFVYCGHIAMLLYTNLQILVMLCRLHYSNVVSFSLNDALLDEFSFLTVTNNSEKSIFCMAIM